MCQGRLEAAAYGSGPDGAYAENTEVAAILEPEFDCHYEFDSWCWMAKKHFAETALGIAMKPEAEKDPVDAHRQKKIEEEDAAAAAGDAESEVDNKKEDKHRKHLKLSGEIGFAVKNNPYVALAVNLKGLLEKHE